MRPIAVAPTGGADRVTRNVLRRRPVAHSTRVDRKQAGHAVGIIDRRRRRRRRRRWHHAHKLPNRLELLAHAREPLRDTVLELLRYELSEVSAKRFDPLGDTLPVRRDKVRRVQLAAARQLAVPLAGQAGRRQVGRAAVEGDRRFAPRDGKLGLVAGRGGELPPRRCRRASRGRRRVGRGRLVAERANLGVLRCEPRFVRLHALFSSLHARLQCLEVHGAHQLEHLAAGRHLDLLVVRLALERGE
mmetsp:Transcript_19668/g.62618  ORF Transcript_19668/g.62618 Transcript_19668/m.62618 type:complete len:245 (-) Transcript_19668:805-1539(-)